MKIAVWHNLSSGGGKRALYHHVRGLVERGHQLDVWCPEGVDADYLPLSEHGRVRGIPLSFATNPHKPRWMPWCLRDYRFARAQVVALDEHCRYCAAQVERGGYDVLFANACHYLAVSRMGTYANLPSVLYLQEPRRKLYEALPELPWIAAKSAHGDRPRRLRRHLSDLLHVHALRLQAREELENVQNYNSILVNSLYSRESLLRVYGLDSRVCYLGVDTRLFRPTGGKRERLVVSVGAFAYHKGPERAIAALAALPEDERPPMVWIANYVSPGDYRASVEALAKSNGVDLRLRVMVGDGELVDVLNRATVMIYTPRLEPFGFAPLEASACELPVVAIAEGGVRETVEHGFNGLLVPDADPHALAQALREVLRNPTLAADLGQAGRQRVVKEWTWNAAVDRLEAALTRTATQSGCVRHNSATHLESLQTP